jgi:hypothetical protein
MVVFSSIDPETTRDILHLGRSGKSMMTSEVIVGARTGKGEKTIRRDISFGSRNKRTPPTATNMNGDATQLTETKTNFINISDNGEVDFSPPTRINWS